VVPTRPEWTGRSLAEVATAAGAHPVDVLCDQVLRDDFATLIDVPIMNRSREGAVRFLEDPHTLLGLGDSGAHVQSVTNYRYPTFLLAEIVRRDGLLSLERAVQQLTQVPARLHGLAGRGVLAPGAAADVCVIDPERLALGPVSMRRDLPGDAQRLYQEGAGYRAVFVNGVQTIADDTPTGEAPGTFLRVAD